MTVHLPGALSAASIIANGRETVDTIFGRKTVIGLADLIERETGIVELLTVACGALGYLEALPPEYRPDEAWFAPLRAAILRVAPPVTVDHLEPT